MTGFDLPSNFREDPESLVRRVRLRVVPPQKILSVTNPVDTTDSAPSTSAKMAGKTIREYSAPATTNVPVGPTPPVGDGNFELKPALINMVQASPFCGKPNEDANAHLQHFLEICNTFTIRGVGIDAIRLRLFPFSLLGKAKQWFYADRNAVDTWEKCSAAFLAKFFPLGKTSALRNKISSFQQQSDETISEAWERLQEYIAACPHHGMEQWFLIQTFYHGLKRSAREHIDAAAGGAFFSLEVGPAKILIEKMVSNQGWSDERSQPRTRGVHQIDGVDMLAAKMDLLMKKLEAPTQETAKAMDSRMKMPSTSTTATPTMGTGRTTSATKDGILGQISPSTSHKEVTISITAISIINLLLKISCLAKLKSMIASVKSFLLLIKSWRV